MVVPSARLGLVGDTWIDCRVAEVTFSVVLPDTPFMVAVIVVNPLKTDVASPTEPGMLLTVAIDVDDDVQVTDRVTSCIVLSE